MHSISGKSKRKISCLFAKIWIQMINLLSLGGISRMVEHSIAVSPICMPCKVFCVISISKQMLKPWNDHKIPQHHCWGGFLWVFVTVTLIIIFHFVPWYPTPAVFVHFFKLMYAQYTIIGACMNLLILYTHQTQYLLFLIVTFWQCVLLRKHMWII